MKNRLLVVLKKEYKLNAEELWVMNRGELGLNFWTILWDDSILESFHKGYGQEECPVL